MPVMVIPKDSFGQPGQPLTSPSILLASDSERHGALMHWILKTEGFPAHFAGKYAQLDGLLASQPFDMVLLEVTGRHAVEDAVATALRVKRAHTGQFVGYLADSTLDADGLAGDAVFPRNAESLRQALRSFFSDASNGA